MNILMPDEQQITQYTINNTTNENTLKIFNFVFEFTKYDLMLKVLD